VERTVAWVTPLVSELQHFCQRHEEGERGGAAAGMLAHLRHDWADLPVVDLPPVIDRDRDAEELALIIIRDVGEVADILLAGDVGEARLGWARANLILDLERYWVLAGAVP
jgi:hypothetical protein